MQGGRSTCTDMNGWNPSNVLNIFRFTTHQVNIYTSKLENTSHPLKIPDYCQHEYSRSFTCSAELLMLP